MAAFDALYRLACVERDAAAAAALFVDDAAIWFSGSDADEHVTTRADLLALLGSIASSPRTLRFAWTEQQVHMSGDTAWVNAAGSVALTGPSGEHTIPYRVTAVLLRRDGRWLWHTHAGSAPGNPER